MTETPPTSGRPSTQSAPPPPPAPPPRPEVLSIVTADGHRSEARFFRAAAGRHSDSDVRPRFAVFPAMGVRARYYDPLGEALSAAGCDAIVAELRGQGTSSHRASRRCDWGYETAIRQDWPAVLAAFERRTGVPAPRPPPDAVEGLGSEPAETVSPLYLLGHSLGGQVSSLYLAAHPGAAAGLVLVASGTNWHRNWGFPRGLAMLARIQAGGLIARGLGFFPGRTLGFADLQARQEIVDWAATGRHGRFVPRGAGLDYEAALARLQTRVFAFTFEGDDYATAAAADHLLGKLRAARITRRHLTSADAPAACLHHFAWVRQPAPILAHILGAISAQSVTL